MMALTFMISAAAERLDLRLVRLLVEAEQKRVLMWSDTHLHLGECPD